MVDSLTVPSRSQARTRKDYRIGAEVGGYRITAKLGEGAMGAVYRAEHSVLGRKAAIKFLNQELGRNPELVSRFFSEAQVVNSIRHPNIVDITDFGQRGQQYYYLMELLVGETLEERIASKGKLDEESTRRVGAQVAGALAAAHEKGVIHRDLKPENIFLCNHPDYPDYVKLFDFGVAKLMSDRTGNTHKTKAGVLLGTPLYMSPEQCMGKADLDHRSDVYALGVVLYQMVTGTVPFDGETFAEILMGHMGEEFTPPKALAPKISHALNVIIIRAMQKEPDERFADMREMRAALEAPVIEEEEYAHEPEPESDLGRAGTMMAVGTPAPQSDAPIGEVGAGKDKIVEELRTIIMERIKTGRLVLPSMPAAAMAALDVIDRPAVTFRQLQRILENDPVLTPQIFSRASAARFGNADRPRTLEQAISRLGFANLKTTLIELSAHKVYDSRNRRIRKAFRGIWDHTLAVANASRALAEATDLGVSPDEAHLAGLMHDVGKPVVASLLLEAEKMLGMRRQEWLEQDAWISVVEEVHQEVGYELAKSWKLPPEVVSVIKDCDSYSSDPSRMCSNLVRIANAAAKRIGKVAGSFDEEANEDILVEGVDMLELDWVFIYEELSAAMDGALANAPQMPQRPGKSTDTIAAV